MRISDWSSDVCSSDLSSLGEDSVTDPPLPPAAADAARRGSLLHGLFERLPAAPPARRRDLAEPWLARPRRAPDSAHRAALVDAPMPVIEDPAFAHLFAPAALPEPPQSDARREG